MCVFHPVAFNTAFTDDLCWHATTRITLLGVCCFSETHFLHVHFLIPRTIVYFVRFGCWLIFHLLMYV